MDPKVYAILTVVVIGIISFLIGWLITSSKWRRKYEDENQHLLTMSHQKRRLEKSLDQSKKMQEEGRARLKLVNTDVRLLEQEVKQLKKDKKYLTAKLYDKSTDVISVKKDKTSLHSLFDEEQLKSVTTYTKVVDLEEEAPDPAIKGPKVGNTFILDEQVQDFTDQVKVVEVTDKWKPLAHIVRRTSIFSNKEHQDDLQAINGIDNDIAKQLKEVGFNNYKQIAMLTAKDLEDISKTLGFDKDKAMNGAWVAQANKLYHAKYDV